MGINIVILALVLATLHYRDRSLRAHISVTESVVLGLGEDIHYQYLIMGSSHGRNLVRGSHFSLMERNFPGKIACIAQTAAGVLPEYLWLQYFYSSSNRADTIIYVIDPFVMYSPEWNEKLTFLSNEPFRWGLFSIILTSELTWGVKFNYIKSKFSQAWTSSKGISLQDESGSLKAVDQGAVDQRIKALYPDRTERHNFRKYEEVLHDIVRCASGNNSRIVFVLPPTLLGDVPGKEELLRVLTDLETKNLATYYDFSHAVGQPQYFYNHDHLNFRGTDWYLSNCLSLAF